MSEPGTRSVRFAPFLWAAVKRVATWFLPLIAACVAAASFLFLRTGGAGSPPGGTGGTDALAVVVALGGLATGLISAIAALISAIAAYRTATRSRSAPPSAAPADPPTLWTPSDGPPDQQG